MLVIRFKARLQKPDAAEKIGSEVILMLPGDVSAKLPSRGTTMVEGVINSLRFSVPLEPDGRGSHWFRVNKTMREAAGVDIGDTVTLEIKSTKTWPEPKIPTDLKNALEADLQAQALWADITPMARWEWIRWMDSVVLPKTRKERPKKLCSMLRSGKRRPCCFNRAMRTLPKGAELL